MLNITLSGGMLNCSNTSNDLEYAMSPFPSPSAAVFHLFKILQMTETTLQFYASYETPPIGVSPDKLFVVHESTKHCVYDYALAGRGRGRHVIVSISWELPNFICLW